MSEAPFRDLLRRVGESGGFQTDDLLAAMLPLCRQVAGWHEQSLVAPLRGLRGLLVDGSGGVRLEAHEGVGPTNNLARIVEVQRPVASALRVVGSARVTAGEESGTDVRDLQVIQGDAEVQHPAFVAGYGSWEMLLGHHDALTDVFLVGQLFASLALGLDFADEDDLGIFAAHRGNLFAVNERLHPVLAAAIVEMTELNRHQRAQDLAAAIRRLESYREQPVDVDVARLPGFVDAGIASRRQLVQTNLRDRLFELSRRNRLLHFRPSQASLNLTVSSVPLVVNLASIRPEQLFYWHPALAAEVVEGRPLSLGRWLRFEDYPYLKGALDKILADARRDRSEYGFAQLRLVLAFLSWHNLKEAPEERVVSPLLLLPVELARKKGVRDQYILERTSTEVEVNPALRHLLRNLYGLELPEAIELSQTSVVEFYRQLAAQIRATEPGVELRLVDQPEIQLIHERARQRLAQFHRRQKLRPPPSGRRTKASFDYSYDRESFRPLGLQLFRAKVLPTPLPGRAAAGGAPDARPLNMVAPTPAPVPETERQMFALRQERPGNPYAWDFDLCSLTLSNLNYRKMSLVRDYGGLLEGELTSESFDRVFSIDPRPLDDTLPPVLDRAETWPVVAGDATQAAAVALGRSAQSYIIQGPPGTGKSQTITNLIADYAARGKRVLFVCEKRAALDVVFHRLRQQGLDELCCLIHDSQADKKSFVHNLKQTYEKWIEEPDGAEAARSRRDGLLRQIEADLDALRRFDRVMQSVPEHVARPVRDLLKRLVELRGQEPALDPVEAERLPEYAVWHAHAGTVEGLTASLRESTGAECLGAHPFRLLADGVLRAERPLEALQDLTSQAEGLLDEVESAFAASGLAAEHWDTLEELQALAAFAVKVGPLADRGHLALLDPRSELSRRLVETAAGLEGAEAELARAAAATVNWRDKLASTETAAALSRARACESSWLRWLQPGWWSLRKAVRARYDFSVHAVRPTISQVLGELDAEHSARARLEELRRRGRQELEAEPLELLALVRMLQARDLGPAAVGALRERLVASPAGVEAVERLRALAPELGELVRVLQALIIDCGRLDLTALGEAVRDLREEAGALPDVLLHLTELADAPAELGHALRAFALRPAEIEAAVARRALERIYRTERWLPRFDGRVLAQRAERAAGAEKSWLAANAIHLRAEARRRFREHVHVAATSATQLDADGKLFKKRYTTGRRELEHEFGKTMRYRSIRDLAAAESGLVLRDLKPIWLMSPLSVSDTLPLSPDLFDVVIFDEASQIPVEEAVPALYRAPQVIVVGDEMQLPPTRFFAAARDESDDTVELEEAGERVAVALDADSFLTQSARNLPATLLAWHYRSRSESLISFSNAAFYAGSLHTIPDRELPAPEQPELIVRGPVDAQGHVDALLSRSISFHFLERSPYVDRRNPGEADYVAHLVREILKRRTGLSIGIVAFSEAQQAEIESALQRLASDDADFAALLEAEEVREEDDQFCGLFVKNLENVQGDERDMVLLSVCYGPDEAGRMVMNFGPINQRGGEKRLNVIFSRARKHMAVVSSVRHQEITNDYNDGAAALKGYLRFAENISRGDLRGARGVLEGLNPLQRRSLAAEASPDAVLVELAQALRARGHTVDEGVGQSRFRCHLAVRAADDRRYALGIVVDTAEHYANPDVAERLVTQPGILRAFGWRIILVLTRDWYHEPEAVVERIERLLRGEAEAAVELADDAPKPAAPVPAQAPGAPPSAPVSGADAPAPVRRLELVEGRSAKFWEITRDGCAVSVRYGRLGSQGQSQTRTFPTAERAVREVEKLVAEKVRKGYRDAGAGGAR